MKQAVQITSQQESETITDNGTLFVDQSLRTRMLDYGLSRREQEIALLALRGLSNREIANLLYICEQTVKDHLYTTFSKLSIHRRSQLAPKLSGLPAGSSAPQFLLS